MKSIAERNDAYPLTVHAAGPRASARTTARQIGNAALRLWIRARSRYEARMRRMVAEAIYTELSKLSDADLRLRGMRRGDLYHLTREIAER
jgi:hypothetical protein